jgi:triphosphoribosyl-dephospho-CoA synthase
MPYARPSVVDASPRDLTPEKLGRMAADALRAEALLTPKPGLVDGRGSGAHHDMDLCLLLSSADVLEPWFSRFAQAASDGLATGKRDIAVRLELGRLGREAEGQMLEASSGVNTHRGALFSLGFLVAGAARVGSGESRLAAQEAGGLAGLPDIALERRRSHGDVVREWRPGVGAAPEASSGYPTALKIALPALRHARRCGMEDNDGRLNALLAAMTVLEDTCVLFRGGSEGLNALQRSATDVLATGGVHTVTGSQKFGLLDRLCRERRLSPGGAADVLASAIFLDRFSCDHQRGGQSANSEF